MLEEIQTHGKSVEDLARPEDADPRRSQLDRERQPVQRPQHVDDRRRVCRRWLEPHADEAGAVGAPPAVINAIVDALHRKNGLRHIDMPATPRKVWEAVNGR